LMILASIGISALSIGSLKKICHLGMFLMIIDAAAHAQFFGRIDCLMIHPLTRGCHFWPSTTSD